MAHHDGGLLAVHAGHAVGVADMPHQQDQAIVLGGRAADTHGKGLGTGHLPGFEGGGGSGAGLGGRTDGDSGADRQ